MRILPLALVAVVGLAAGCSRPEKPAPPPEAPADVLATIGPERITEADFQSALARRRPMNDPKARRALLDEMIRFRGLVLEAKRRGYDRDPRVVQAYENLLASKVREAEEEGVRAQAKVAPAEVEAYYNAHVAEYTAPTKVRGAAIFIEAPATFSPEARAERLASLQAAKEKALALPPNTPGFGPVAAEYSYDQATKFHGGDMGYMIEGAMVQGWEKPVVDALFGLKEVGQLSEVITTAKGYYLVRLTERKPGSVRGLETMRAQLERRLVNEKQHELLEASLDKLSADQPVKVYEDRLAAVKPASSPKPESSAPPTGPSSE